MKSEFYRILLSLGFTDNDADRCAELFTCNSIDGVYSHGVNRFPRFVKNIQGGYIIPGSEPTLTGKTGALEQWNGNQGPGPLNAIFATDRACALAAESGIGLVTLANTNHWMRAGAYGWQAAGKGFILIAWTNTEPNMPAWGARDHRLGNNPMVFAIPYGKTAIILDFAMTQFSYGKMESYRLDGKQLPFAGGYNKNDQLTWDPSEILESWRPLPIGYWKGAGLSLLLDIFATVLSGGISVSEISKRDVEYGVSQVFIAIDLTRLSNFTEIERSVDKIIEDYRQSETIDQGDKIRYPGENVVRTREYNKENGIPVNKAIWAKIRSL